MHCITTLSSVTLYAMTCIARCLFLLVGWQWEHIKTCMESRFGSCHLNLNSHFCKNSGRWWSISYFNQGKRFYTFYMCDLPESLPRSLIFSFLLVSTEMGLSGEFIESLSNVFFYIEFKVHMFSRYAVLVWFFQFFQV